MPYDEKLNELRRWIEKLAEESGRSYEVVLLSMIETCDEILREENARGD